MKVQTNFRGVFCGFGAQITVLGRLEVRTTRHHNLAEHQPPPPRLKPSLADTETRAAFGSQSKRKSNRSRESPGSSWLWFLHCLVVLSTLRESTKKPEVCWRLVALFFLRCLIVLFISSQVRRLGGQLSLTNHPHHHSSLSQPLWQFLFRSACHHRRHEAWQSVPLSFH